MIIQLLFEEPIIYLMMAVSLLIALSVHEYAHAQMAYFLGDSTAKDLGRLTVNPLRHLDPMGTILLLTVGIGWGRPVPFNFLNLRNKKHGPMLIALSGPASNFSMALIVGFVLRFAPLTNPGLISFFAVFVWLNIMLGVFNLLPVPPLDGSHILFAFLPRSLDHIKIFLARYGFFILIFFIFFFFQFFVFVIKLIYVLIVGSPLPFI